MEEAEAERRRQLARPSIMSGNPSGITTVALEHFSAVTVNAPTHIIFYYRDYPALTGAATSNTTSSTPSPLSPQQMGGHVNLG